MDRITYNLLIAINKCHQFLKRHADTLATRTAVKSVRHFVDLPSIQEAFRLEEYIDVEFLNGEAVSWCLELTIMPEYIHVEADLRRIHGKGQDVVAEIANCDFRNEADCSEGIIEITQKLCASSYS